MEALKHAQVGSFLALVTTNQRDDESTSECRLPFGYIFHRYPFSIQQASKQSPNGLQGCLIKSSIHLSAGVLEDLHLDTS